MEASFVFQAVVEQEDFAQEVTDAKVVGFSGHRSLNKFHQFPLSWFG